IPGMMVILLSFTPLGSWFIGQVMGVQGELLQESLRVLRVMGIVAIVFPWVDYCNGLSMLARRTQLMLWSQIGNVAMTLIVLFTLSMTASHWNGMVGALAFSSGIAAELLFMVTLLRRGRSSMTS